MPSVLLNQKEQELLNMKTVTLKNNRRWVQDLECSVLHRLTLATKIPRVLNKKHTVEKTMKKNRNKRVDFCLLSLTQYLPPHHLRPLSILFTELENTKNTVESTCFFFFICLPCPQPVSFTVLPLVGKGINLLNNRDKTEKPRFTIHLIQYIDLTII